jgi:hypothetical protein
MSLVGDTKMEGKGTGNDLEAQNKQANEKMVEDDSHDSTANSGIDVKQSKQMFHDMESRMASESGTA